MSMPRSIYNYMRAKAAAKRKERREYEKAIRDEEKLRLKQKRDYERNIFKAERDALRKAEAAAKLQRMEERIEARLRKQYGLPKDGTIVVVIEATNRLLEI